MKYLSLVVLFIFPVLCNAQKTYNNKIGEVKELNIYGKDANIVIGKIIINNSDQSPIKLLESIQSQQPNGTFLTAFAFGHTSPAPLYNVNLKLTFNLPVDSLKDLGMIMWTGDPKQHGLSQDKLSYTFIASKIEASINNAAVFVVRVFSTTKIKTTITGVDTN